jgi:hypothetical protein
LKLVIFDDEGKANEQKAALEGLGAEIEVKVLG